MDMTFNIDPDEFQQRKKARIEEMRKPHGKPSRALKYVPRKLIIHFSPPGRL